MYHFVRKNVEYILLSAFAGFVLYQASLEFYNIAWGTGRWWGEFSLLWFMLFLLFSFFCVGLFVFINYFIWRRRMNDGIMDWFASSREKISGFRWLILVCLVFIPPWLLQYTVLGIMFRGAYIRILIWFVDVFLLAFILADGQKLIGWGKFLAALIITAGVFSITASVKNVTDYPFSLGWSEGNRIWDYSIMFGRGLYDYPADAYIPVLLDAARQFIGGLPFLIPGLTLWMERLWISFTQIIPYFLVGFAIFRSFFKNNKNIWILMVVWMFLFLKQGPIHASLVVSAALVALAWRNSLWVSIPLLIISGYFAQASRFSWSFAPGMWIVMLEFSYASSRDGKLNTQAWIRSASLGFAGIFGGYLLPKLLGLFGSFQAVGLTLEDVGEIAANSGLTPAIISREVTHQPLLWYRLLPNSTYETGVLFGLLLAVGPLLVILFYVSVKKIWLLRPLQKLSIIFPLLAFLMVGLIASTKIGGGGDLHNLDMFLIGLSFTAVVAFNNGGSDWLTNSNLIPSYMKIVLLFSLLIPAFAPLKEMRSYEFGEQLSWLVTLTDAPEGDTLDMLPTGEVVRLSLQTIQEEVDGAKLLGEVLFIDQRQLLTFHYISDVSLVPEYEKKMLMNQALSSGKNYFQDFYRDLANHRFQLIVSEPLRTPVKDSSFEFGEENNAWVKWVSAPVLCYYEPKETLHEIGVQLLVPRQGVGDCAIPLP